MRLTLRTLLAWLDDTLEPSQVREIGKQVSQSPFAQELAERIHRVTRQRRLSVPSGSGPDAADPNVVAGYLDNDLDPEAVAEFEKKCLTSDVHLAEVASVHQILSLLGQKVKVPPEARARMNQLVKGREAISPRAKVRIRPLVAEPVSAPLQPWVVPEAPKRPWWERLGPPAACILLMIVAIWSAWWSVRRPGVQPAPVPPGPAVAAQAAPAQPEPVPAEAPAAVAEAPKPQPGPPAEAAAAAPAGPPAHPEPVDVSKAAPSSQPAAKPHDEATAPAVPAGASGLAEKSDGLLLRYNPDPEKRQWERLTEPTPLNRPDRLLCLAPFRASITLGKLRLTLVDETEVRIFSLSSDSVPVLELVQGRLLIRQPSSSALKVVFSDRTASLEMPPESSVALERVEARPYGQLITRTPPLVITCIQGELSFTVDQKPESLKAASVAVVDRTGRVRLSTPDSLPSWITQTETAPDQLQARDQFLPLFHPGDPFLKDLVMAAEDERPEIKRLAISALQALGDLSYLMPILRREGDPVARRSAVAAIRAYMGRGPEAVNHVREQLDDEFGPDPEALALHMLIGFSPDEAAHRDTYARLVGLLSPDQAVGIRELALDTLKRLTGRDDLGYDPDHPGGKGLETWNQLLRQNQLRPQPARAARAK